MRENLNYLLQSVALVTLLSWGVAVWWQTKHHIHMNKYAKHREEFRARSIKAIAAIVVFAVLVFGFGFPR